ncbi:metal ABC transporter solute-binding protein, Zn/Mn family [Escherichia coli]|nr:zinc ABC transporter substrate-binding protein [Escherichia coli]
MEQHKNGIVYARNIINDLSKADPEHAIDYRKQDDSYIQQFQQLDN